MKQNPDTRSKQRFNHFEKALHLYEEASATQDRKLSRLEEEGLIHRFEYTFELAWKCLQDLLQERGYENIRGPRPVIEQSFQDGISTNGPLWMEMLRARNETMHLYDETIFNSVLKKIKGPFHILLQEFRTHFPK